MRRLPAIVVTLAFAGRALAADDVIWTFSQWATFPTTTQDAYVIGLLDTMRIVGALEKYQQRHMVRVDICLARSRLGIRQISQNILEYSKNNPGVYSGNVLQAFNLYMYKLCPDLLNEKTIQDDLDEEFPIK